MYSEETLKIPRFPSISSYKYPSEPQNVRTGRNAYWKPGFAIAAILIPGIAILTLPQLAGASWPFFSVSHAETGVDSPVTHDSSLPLLEAPLNSNSNSTPASSSDLTSADGTVLLPSTGPNGSLPDATDTSNDSSGGNASGQAGGGQISTYTVKEGDSLSRIASDHGVSVSTILWANDISNANTIKPGDSLIILPVSGLRYTVKKGDTLSTIAAKYNADAKEIAIFNGIGTETSLAAGSDIIIPGGEQGASASAKNTPAKAAKAAKTTTTKTKSTTKTTSASDKAALASIEAPSATVPTSGYFQNPVPGAYLTQGIHGNNGVDLGSPTGTPIHAAAAGKVIIAKTDGGWNGGYGNYVVVSHSNGTQTLYSHMSRDIASVGETVSAGTVLGYVGTTGEATGPHLHFEVRGGKNPFGYSCTVMKKCY